MATWPAPLLQPDPHTGCMQYSVAYLCRALGFPDVTPADVSAYRHERHYCEDSYPKVVLGAEMHRWSEDADDEVARRRWWLGPDARPWVEGWFERGYIALWHAHRALHIGHLMVGVEARGDEGVLVVDPLSGFIVEPWAWILGPGVRPDGDYINHPCHRIDGWYRMEKS